MRPKLSDVLTAELRREVKQGTYGTSGRLPAENVLAKRFEVSRPIVREALKQLRDEGLITSRQGAGSFVSHSDVAEKEVSGPANPEASLQSIADVRKVYEFRIALEGEIAATAAINARTDQVEWIKTKLDAIQTSITEGVPGVEQDFEFHMAIAAATGNELFEQALDLIRPNLNFVIDLARSFTSLGTPEHVAMVQREHAEIYEAIVARDSAAARAAMQNHIIAARNRVFFGVRVTPNEAVIGRITTD